MALDSIESRMADEVEKAAKRVAKRAKEEVDETPAQPEPFTSTAAALAEVVAKWEAEQNAKAARTAVGKRFGDRVKSANEKLKSAIEDGSRTATGKLHAKLVSAKANVKLLTAKWEEAADGDKGAIGRAYRSRGKLLEERAEAKEKAGAKVERTSDAFEAVMARVEASQLDLPF